MSARRVVLTGPLPPPVTGAALVTERMRDTLAGALAGTAGRLVVVDSNSNASAPARVLRLLTGLLRLALLVALRRRPAVYVGGAGGELLWFQALVVAIGVRGGGPVLFHHHSYQPIVEPSAPMRAITRWGGARLTHVVLGGDMGRRLTERYPAATHVVACSNAGHMPLADDAPPAPGAPGVVVLAHHGNLSVSKGLDRVLDALDACRAAGLDAVLHLGGPADEQSTALIEAATARHGERVRWRGPLAPAEVADFLAAADVFLFPTRYPMEAEPLVVLEAVRAGLPVVASARGCIPGLVDAPGSVVEEGPDADGAVRSAIVDLVGHVASLDDARRAALRGEVKAGFDRRQHDAARTWADLASRLTGR
ncbi:glycosyltransferase family 4 protein [Nocardioides sp.]|uniref:glycosyltransferase family 4 protein n=1 Tax=Nocardioides sp. TaxID=35761 RepID=UPI003515C33D